MLKTLGIVLLSLPGIFTDALFLSAIVWLLGPAQRHVPWHSVFWWCVPGAILLFCWIDRHTTGSDLLEDATWNTGPTTPGGLPAMLSLGFGASGYGIGGGSTPGMPILTQILLSGPRQLRKVVNRLRSVWMFDRRSRQRAGRVLQHLLTVDHSCAIQSLLEPSEQMQQLMPALAYLVFYDWISESPESQHVWLSGQSRNVLQHALRV
jgi:hypothetical protein